MGAFNYQTQYSAKTAREAFEGAKRMTQTEIVYDDDDDRDAHERVLPAPIAKTGDFEMEYPRPRETIDACADRILGDTNHWCQDKDEVAACFDTGPDPARPGYRIFRFVGFAST